MSFNKIAQDYLDKCRVIGYLEVKEGIIVSSTLSSEFKVSTITVESGDVNEDVIGEFSLLDFYDSDKSKMVMNFKKTMTEIVGRKKYYIEEDVYNFLADIEVDYEDLEINYDDAEERAKREAEEEEEAEQNFETFLKIMEDM